MPLWIKRRLGLAEAIGKLPPGLLPQRRPGGPLSNTSSSPGSCTLMITIILRLFGLHHPVNPPHPERAGLRLRPVPAVKMHPTAGSGPGDPPWDIAPSASPGLSLELAFYDILYEFYLRPICTRSP